MMPFSVSSIIYRNNVEFTVLSKLPSGDVQVQNKLTGEFERVSASQLLLEYCSGELRVKSRPINQFDKNNIPMKTRPRRMYALSLNAKAASKRMIQYLVQFEKRGTFLLGAAQVKKDTAAIAAELGDLITPSQSTAYRWWGEYKERSDISDVFPDFDRRGGRGISRLDPEVEEIIDLEIDAALSRSVRWSAETILEGVETRTRRLNELRIRSAQLVNPSIRTIQRRLKEIPAFDIAAAKYGYEIAEKRFRFIEGSRWVDEALDLVEIDHTPADILILDPDTGLTYRPNLTIVLDRRTRCVLGFNVSKRGNGTASVMAAIIHALLPKSYLAAKYPGLDLIWPCYGWFAKVLMDNGAEFHGESVSDALLNIDIISEYSKSREPNDKACIERFNRTINYGFIHRLPGTTLDKVHKRIGMNSEKEAVLTIEQFEELLHVWICKKYHNRPHVGLGGQTPLQAWTASTSKVVPKLKMNARDLMLEMGSTEESALQKHGIDLNTFRYASPELSNLYRTLPARTRVIVKWSELQAGYINVWNQIDSNFIEVPNVDKRYINLTVPQAKALKKLNKRVVEEDRVTLLNGEEYIASTIDEINTAKKKNKKKIFKKMLKEEAGSTRPVRVIEVENIEGAHTDLDVKSKRLPAAFSVKKNGG